MGILDDWNNRQNARELLHESIEFVKTPLSCCQQRIEDANPSLQPTETTDSPNMIVDRARIESVLRENETPPSEEEQEEEVSPASPFHYALDEFVGSFELYTNSQGYPPDDFNDI